MVLSINSNKVILNGTPTPLELDAYSETSKIFWECIRTILCVLSFSCLKFDPFLKISLKDRTIVYILPEQIKAGYTKLNVTLPATISQTNLSLFIQVGTKKKTIVSQASTLPPPDALPTIQTVSSSSSSSSSATSIPTVSPSPEQTAITDTQAKQRAKSFLTNQPHKLNTIANLRDLAFQEDIENFAKHHPRVQDHILATLVMDGVVPDHIKKHYDEHPDERPFPSWFSRSYRGVPKAFKLYIDRLSPKRQAVFKEQFGTIDLEKCSDDQAKTISTFFMKGHLETTPILSLKSPVSVTTEAAIPEPLKLTNSASSSTVTSTTALPLPPRKLIDQFQEKVRAGLDLANDTLIHHTTEAFDQYTPVQQIEFIHILICYFFIYKDTRYVTKKDIVYYITRLKTDQHVSQDDLDELTYKNSVCNSYFNNEEDPFTSLQEEYFTSLNPKLRKILRKHAPEAEIMKAKMGFI